MVKKRIREKQEGARTRRKAQNRTMPTENQVKKVHQTQGSLKKVGLELLFESVSTDVGSKRRTFSSLELLPQIHQRTRVSQRYNTLIQAQLINIHSTTAVKCHR